VSEKSLRDEAVARDEGIARAVSETFGCQLNGTPKPIAPKRGCVLYTAAVRIAKKEILVQKRPRTVPKEVKMRKGTIALAIFCLVLPVSGGTTVFGLPAEDKPLKE
jgi:hypothetical protein